MNIQFGIAEAVGHWGQYRGTHAAVIANGRRVSFAELDQLVNRVTSAVVVTPHDRLAVAARSKLTLLAMILGVVRARRTVIVVNPALSVESLRTNVNEARAECLFHDDGSATLAEAVTNGSAILRCRAREDAPDERRLRVVREIAPPEIWGVLFSSGTTGTPKGIERGYYSVATELIGWCLELGLTKGTTFYIGRPIYYTGGLVLALSTLLVGGCVVLDDYSNDSDFDEIWNDYAAVAADTQLSWAFVVPDQLRSFTAHARLARNGFRRAESVLLMGGLVSGAEKLAAREALGSQIVESWGNTESLGTITSPEDLDTRPDSIGRPFLTDQMCIVDDSGHTLPPGQVGRLAGDQEAGFDAYCSRPIDTERVKRNDLIISDDIGYCDNDGYFYILGRVQDSVVHGGQTYLVSQIETALQESDNIRACAIVVTRRSADESPLLVAFIVAAPEVSLRDVEGMVRLKADPLIVAHVKIVTDLPRVGAGKVDRVELTRRANAIISSL